MHSEKASQVKVGQFVSRNTLEIFSCMKEKNINDIVVSQEILYFALH